MDALACFSLGKNLIILGLSCILVIMERKTGSHADSLLGKLARAEFLGDAPVLNLCALRNLIPCPLWKN